MKFVTKEIPIWKKNSLSTFEASCYFNIGMNNMYILLNQLDRDYFVYIGSVRRIKREKLERYLDEQCAI